MENGRHGNGRYGNGRHGNGRHGRYGNGRHGNCRHGNGVGMGTADTGISAGTVGVEGWDGIQSG